MPLNKETKLNLLTLTQILLAFILQNIMDPDPLFQTFLMAPLNSSSLRGPITLQASKTPHTKKNVDMPLKMEETTLIPTFLIFLLLKIHF